MEIDRDDGLEVFIETAASDEDTDFGSVALACIMMWQQQMALLRLAASSHTVAIPRDFYLK